MGGMKKKPGTALSSITGHWQAKGPAHSCSIEYEFRLVISDSHDILSVFYEREDTSEVCGLGDPVRLRECDQNQVDEAGDHRGYLQCLPSVLHGPAEVCRYRRSC